MHVPPLKIGPPAFVQVRGTFPRGSHPPKSHHKGPATETVQKNYYVTQDHCEICVGLEQRHPIWIRLGDRHCSAKGAE